MAFFKGKPLRGPWKPGLGGRYGAWMALVEWHQGQGFVAERLADFWRRSETDYEARERALAQEIALGVVRQGLLLDAQIRRLCPKKPDPALAILLKTALYQLFWMPSLGNHAAVDTAVELAKKIFGPHLVGFVNAVLRKASLEALWLPEGNRTRDLALRYSHPEWMVRRWIAARGSGPTVERLRSGTEVPPQWVRRHPGRMSAQALQSSAWAEPDTLFAERYVRVQSSLREVLEDPNFAVGAISIQDPASWCMVRLLLGDLLGEGMSTGHEAPLRIMDLCAAPGGKSALILEDLPESFVVSAELKENRAQKLWDLRVRGGHPVHPVVQDALAPAFVPRSFDRILVDAPCSNLGVLGRRPEARYQALEDLQVQAQIQLKILSAAAELLGPNGVLVYGTCSPEPEETHEIVKSFLAAHPEFYLEDAQGFLGLALLESEVRDGMLELWPKPGHWDGFFGARLRRRL
jgi:16S rRNA (cytosine967-C5)-methyltransferase